MSGQKAPSAKRCIKTNVTIGSSLRSACQKAPSAKRCIKTDTIRYARATSSCQKAPSAKRCIKTIMPMTSSSDSIGSESTERQKVH